MAQEIKLILDKHTHSHPEQQNYIDQQLNLLRYCYMKILMYHYYWYMILDKEQFLR